MFHGLILTEEAFFFQKQKIIPDFLSYRCAFRTPTAKWLLHSDVSESEHKKDNVFVKFNRH